MNNVGRGGGGHGGHGGGARGGFGFPYVMADPWVYEDPPFDLNEARRRREVHGQELLSSGEGALIALALIWYLVHEADKRVPR